MIFGSVQSGLPGTSTLLTFENYARAFSHSALYSARLRGELSGIFLYHGEADIDGGQGREL
jgi:hypothetical protein